MGIDASIIRAEVSPEYRLDQILARNNAAGGPDQCLEEIELDRGKSERFTRASDDPCAFVQFDITGDQFFRGAYKVSVAEGRLRRRIDLILAMSSRGLNGFCR